jgi:hypothetical protein
MMLPTVDFCGLKVTRLILGANPFGGFSHQCKERNMEMLMFHTVPVIKETWARAQAAGINTIITNNESPHVIQAVKEYLAEGGTMQWIAQVNCREQPDMLKAIDTVVEIGCKALYFHGAKTDGAYVKRDDKTLRAWCDHVRSHGVPAGVAGHAPETHYWIDGLDAADFHAVCFFDCGSVHEGKGEKFQLKDMPRAVEFVQKTKKPCIGYKIMGSGRLEARMAFQYAFESIKPGDVVNVGMHRGDKDNMVEEDVALVEEILAK